MRLHLDIEPHSCVVARCFRARSMKHGRSSESGRVPYSSYVVGQCDMSWVQVCRAVVRRGERTCSGNVDWNAFLHTSAFDGELAIFRIPEHTPANAGRPINTAVGTDVGMPARRGSPIREERGVAAHRARSSP